MRHNYSPGDTGSLSAACWLIVPGEEQLNMQMCHRTHSTPQPRQACIVRRHTRRDNKTLGEELLESSCFYFWTIIQEVENVRCYNSDAEGEMSYNEGKEITQGQKSGRAAKIERFTPSLRYLHCVRVLLEEEKYPWQYAFLILYEIWEQCSNRKGHWLSSIRGARL